MSRPRSTVRKAFTLIELMIAMVVIAIMAVVVMPALAPEDAIKLVSASHLLASDLEYAQSASLAQPSDPIVVVFDEAEPVYWLAHASDPDTPINRPGTADPYIMEMGVDLARQLDGVEFEVTNVTDRTIPYDAFGRLDQLADAFVRIHNFTGEIFVSISASTGSVSVVKQSPPVVEIEDPDAEPEKIVVDPGAGAMGAMSAGSQSMTGSDLLGGDTGQGNKKNK